MVYKPKLIQIINVRILNKCGSRLYISQDIKLIVIMNVSNNIKFT